MAFATDADLLVLEPALFRDVAWIGQRLVSGTGSAGGTVLTMSTQDVAFDAAGVGAGNVVLINDAPFEVIDRISGTVLTISRLRTGSDEPLIPIGPVAGAGVSVPTFAPQIAMVHRQVMRMIGIDPDAQPDQARISASAITNRPGIARLEALGALHLIFSSAGSALGPESVFSKKAELYRQRFAEERQRSAAMIDLDGDGQPDAIRRFNIMLLVRG
ncbi:MAG: hypothetical protein Kow0022_06440 [Phycisphaerales bacterium]